MNDFLPVYRNIFRGTNAMPYLIAFDAEHRNRHVLADPQDLPQLVASKSTFSNASMFHDLLPAARPIMSDPTAVLGVRFTPTELSVGAPQSRPGCPIR